jgi:gas vesicle protein
LIGAALGVSAGLLLAPTSGKQARKKISKKSKKLARKMAGYVGIESSIQGVAPKKRNGRAPVEA